MTRGLVPLSGTILAIRQQRLRPIAHYCVFALLQDNLRHGGHQGITVLQYSNSSHIHNSLLPNGLVFSSCLDFMSVRGCVFQQFLRSLVRFLTKALLLDRRHDQGLQ
eukprot:2524377-Amphidinium_carterae.3